MQHTPYTLPTLLSGLAAAGTALYVNRRRGSTPAATEFVAAASLLALMSLSYAGELASATLVGKLAWLDVRWIGICFVPLASLALCLRWNGNDRWLRRRSFLAMATFPAFCLLLAWTNPLHHLMGGDSVLLPRDGYVLRTAPGGPGFWLLIGFDYLCMLITIVIYGRALFSSPIRRRQGAALLVASLLPWAANAIYVFGGSPDPGIDISHLGYGFDCFCWLWGLRQGALFDLVPVARDRVFESLSDAVLVLDVDRRILDCNRAAMALLGQASPVGKSLRELVGEEVSGELTRGGSVHLLGRALEVEAATLSGAGRTSATVVTLRDVTLRRQLEAAREEALRLAEQVSQARGQFLARMSHEVRGPLHGIVGAADLLLSEALLPVPRRYAEAVASSTRGLLDLVDELLDFSKLDADRLTVTLGDVDARKSLEEVATLFSGAAQQKQLLLSVELPPQVGVRADAVRLRQVLVNLVGNAVKFTDSGRIVLRAKREASVYRFEVQDTGIGIASESQARIFEPFVQVSSLPRTGPAGTGLGLSIARRLVELMGGELGVLSQPGAGSTFWFTLPAAEASVRVALAAPIAASTPAGRRGRVLVIDDHEVSLLVTSGMVRREGCAVETLTDARAALALLESTEFALVLVDIRMPGMGGLEFTRTLRERSGPVGQVPVVAVSGDVHDGARDEALRAGLNDWLSKPLQPAHLRRVLDRWLPTEERAEVATDLRSYLEADPATYLRIVEAFQASTPKEVASLVAAARDGAWDRVRQRAHALKGACGIVGAIELEAVCLRLVSARGPLAEGDLDALHAAAARALQPPNAGTRGIA